MFCSVVMIDFLQQNYCFLGLGRRGKNAGIGDPRGYYAGIPGEKYMVPIRVKFEITR